ncbi:MAG: type II toxin-antitoxin system RelE/ParE family toxin [Candidatus Margulisbacteria bacterium]|jgi:putative addiction module killer protein|nr:type II toxin-antitoxin system RelE/ParE family toxin [Candidatus Margulisiibacteriota bacterium]
MDIEISDVYEKWFNKLRDLKAKDIINVRLRRIKQGNLGDNKSLGGGLYEIRIYYGAGYRLYFVNRGERWILILCGGDKSTQSKDIKLARKLAEEIN